MPQIHMVGGTWLGWAPGQHSQVRRKGMGTDPPSFPFSALDLVCQWGAKCDTGLGVQFTRVPELAFLAAGDTSATM